MSTRDERAEATRHALLHAARALFAARGYAAVGTEEVVARAGVTRGALYHHFRDKQDLFREVHEQLEQEVVAAVGAAMGQVAQPMEGLTTGVAAFLDACTDPPFIQIALQDAPTVLGWAAWREIDERYGLGLVSAGLSAAMDAGAIRRQPVRPLAHLLLGALGEAALFVANAADPAAARRRIEPALLAVLDGLRTR